MKVRILLALLIVSPGLFAQNESEDFTVYWASTNFPPGFILNGEHKGTGYGDVLNDFMINNIDSFNQQSIVYPNFARLLSEMHYNKKDVVCTSTLFYRTPIERKELKGIQLFSAPNFVFFLHDLIVKKSKRHLYSNIVSLKSLLEDQDFVLGYSRTTGPKSSKIIGDYIGVNKDISAMTVPDRLKALRKMKNIFVRLSTDTVGGPLKMLLAERVDYILEYEFMVDFEATRLGIKDQIVAIPIAETLDDVSLSAYSCSSSPNGEKVINEINRVLIEKRDTQEYKKLLHYLLPNDVNRIKRYWKEHQNILSIKK